ncbi:extracellular solute-binding protein [[Clostridium] cellulosi]
MLKKFLSISLLTVFLITMAAGCKKPEKVQQKKQEQPVLTIAYDNSKYGDAWIKAISDAYSKENKIKVKLVADSKLNQKAGALLKTGKNVPDIMFLSFTNWQDWASKGYLYDLSGLYGAKIGYNETLKQKIKADYLNFCSYNGKYYIIPWDDGVTGFIYNKTMFRENNWSIPKTMEDFYVLLGQIKAKGIIPIAWSGSEISDWNYAIRTWWAQCEGHDGMVSYLALSSPEAYKQQGRITALENFRDIACDITNNIPDVLNIDANKAEKQFFSSKAAMLLGGSWIETKAAGNIPNGFELGIMQFPAVANAKEPEINVSDAGGFAVIPSKATHKDAAKEFLRYSSTDSMLKLYSQITSSPRPFNYEMSVYDGLSDFGQDVFNIWKKNNNLYMLSKNPLYYGKFGDWPTVASPLLQIYSGQISPQKVVDDNYEYVKTNWNSN